MALHVPLPDARFSYINTATTNIADEIRTAPRVGIAGHPMGKIRKLPPLERAPSRMDRIGSNGEGEGGKVVMTTKKGKRWNMKKNHPKQPSLHNHRRVRVRKRLCKMTIWMSMGTRTRKKSLQLRRNDEVVDGSNHRLSPFNYHII